MSTGWIKNEPNSFGTDTAHFICVVCKYPYTVTPAPKPKQRDWWSCCMSEFCDSYDPDRDAEILFMSPNEIMASGRAVSIKKLGERRRFLEIGTIEKAGEIVNQQPEER